MRASFRCLLLYLSTQIALASEIIDEKAAALASVENHIVSKSVIAVLAELVNAIPLEVFTSYKPVEVQQPPPAPHQEPSCCSETCNCLCLCLICLASLDPPPRHYQC